MCEIAKYFNADLICFNAPFEYPQKESSYQWFNKFEHNERRDAVVKEYLQSLQYIKDQINNLHTNPKDIILLGHSQGGGMAVHIGLEMELSGVISISGDLPYNLQYKKITNTPIYWLEGEKDTYLDENRKKSYRLISNNNNFHFLTLKNSTHNEFKDDVLKLITENTIKI